MDEYRKKNDGEFPNKLEDLKEHVGKSGPHKKTFEEAIQNPITGDNPGYEYVKPASKRPGPVIILYQLRSGKRDESLKVTIANGEQVTIEEQKPRLKEYNETMGK